MKTVAFIFCRGGSKGVPKKNIKLLGDKPLIAHSIEQALSCKGIDRVIVSTDDNAIADVASKYGAEVPFMRPQELATDSSPEWLSWQHAVNFVQEQSPFDIFISLPATAPLRNLDDIITCLDSLDEQTDVVVTVKNASRNPYFNMLTRDQDGYSKRVITPEKIIVRRQDAPEVFDMTTVAYVTRPSFIMKNTSIFDGRLKSVLIPDERALDIDTELDFIIGETLYAKSRL